VGDHAVFCHDTSAVLHRVEPRCPRAPRWYTCPVSRLIVNADDFGLTSGVNRAIVELHQAGVLTSTTLMASANATEPAISLALQNPSLGIGCHIVLVDGEPVLPPREIPTLIDSRTGCFPPKLTTFLSRLFTGRIRSAEIEAEAAAQIALLQHRGLRLTHIDTHKHTHMFPAVLRPVLRAAAKARIHAVRNPFEPEWAVRASPRASIVRSAEVFALRRFGPYFRRILSEEGLNTTDGTIAIRRHRRRQHRHRTLVAAATPLGHLGAGHSPRLQRRRPGQGPDSSPRITGHRTPCPPRHQRIPGCRAHLLRRSESVARTIQCRVISVLHLR
jgi:predicted glycoside hydrolase/deacetylase ChbG (UPF0249 family)